MVLRFVGQFDPDTIITRSVNYSQSYMELEARFTGEKKDYTIVGNKVEDFPEGFVRSPIEDRLK